MPYRTGQPAKKLRLPVLDKLAIKTPCDEPWEEMVGTEQVRFCCRCRKHVYDLSEMPREDAEAFLAEHLETSGELPCARLYRRPDGRVLTSECSRGERVRHVRRVKTAFAVGAAVAAGLAALGDHATTPRLNPDDGFLWVEHDPTGHLVFEDPLVRNARFYTQHGYPRAMGGLSSHDDERED